MKRRSLLTLGSGRAWLAAIGLAVGMLAAAGGPARAGGMNSSPFVKCPTTNLTDPATYPPYALCAVATCFVFNGVAYCGCDVKTDEKSISLAMDFDDGQNVCSVNEQGAAQEKQNPGHGYMVSMFSFASSVELPPSDPKAQALYTCPPVVSSGTYAQCDGGICFTGSEAQSFPGFDEPQGIVCSCPIASPAQASLGYQIPGPYYGGCQKSFFQNCNRQTANANTGSTIYSGAPIGSARLLTKLLYGAAPPINHCPSPN